MGNRIDVLATRHKLVLSIDTSCDETAAAVTRGTSVLSNVIWSQASEHANFGGVMPVLAQRRHRERIEWVVDKALARSHHRMNEIEAIVVVSGPGLAIALGVGITKAKELAEIYQKPLYEINHIEGHIFSCLARPHRPDLIQTTTGTNEIDVSFPAFGLAVSGGHTELILIERPGKYAVLAKTQDDALGEALDKAARMMGLGYPGGAILEQMARMGNPKKYSLPLPLARQREFDSFSYSGLKSAMYRLIDSLNKPLDREQIYDLAACFQNRAFQHLERVIDAQITAQQQAEFHQILTGGGVMANIELRKRLRLLARRHNLKLLLPYSSRLVGDNAAMAGVAFSVNEATAVPTNLAEVDRKPRWRVEES